MSELRKQRRPPPPQLPEEMKAHEFWVAAFEEVEYSVIVGREHVDGQATDLRWHVSIAGQDDVPTWEALAAIAHSVRPGVPFVVGIPPCSWWINVHPHTLHLWEFRDENLLGQWAFERQGHTPT